MKIILIYLPHPYLVQPSMMSPLGLLYVAKAFENDGNKVIIKNYSGWSMDDAITNIEEADLFGITATSLELNDANIFSKLLKNKFKKSKIILGGPGTLTPEFIDFTVIDSIIKGEGENITKTIASNIFNLKKEYISPTISDISQLSFPARHLINSNFKTLSIITSRGCPFNCSFCASPQLTHRTMRYRDSSDVLSELLSIKPKPESIVIYDDMFTANKKHALDICNNIGKLGIKFRINIRAKPLDLDVLNAAKQAGCVEAAVGIESFDDVVLKTLNKQTTVTDNVNALHVLDKVGIDARVLLMIRTPGQNTETMIKNKYWLSRLPYKLIACTNFVPIPGCDVWYNPDKYNIEILTKNQADYNYGFFDSNGEIPLKPLFKIKNRSLDEFHNETIEFKNWLIKLKKVNKG